MFDISVEAGNHDFNKRKSDGYRKLGADAESKLTQAFLQIN
jgi:hypothetical protein